MPPKRKLSHVAADGSARMVDVGGKPVTPRTATAEAWLTVDRRTAVELRRKGALAKGNVFETARLAGILAAKETPRLIPMCHPIPLDVIEVDAGLKGNRVRILVRVAGAAKTGMEMEAMTAAAVAALTVYDMVKSAGKGIEIGPVRLLEKTGGKSGRWVRRRGKNDAAS